MSRSGCAKIRAAISIRPDDVACLSADGEFWQDWGAQPQGVPV